MSGEVRASNMSKAAPVIFHFQYDSPNAPYQSSRALHLVNELIFTCGAVDILGNNESKRRNVVVSNGKLTRGKGRRYIHDELSTLQSIWFRLVRSDCSGQHMVKS